MPLLMHAFFVILAPLTCVIGLSLGGGWVFLGPLWSIVLAAALDLIVPPKAGPVPRHLRPFMAALTWAVLPVVAGVVAYGLWLVATRDMAWWEFWGTAIAVGTVAGGIGITTAHELIHRRHAWERGLGVALLALVQYAHFRIEHVHGHHRRVATPDDPATSRLGEGVYSFYRRTVPAQWCSAWVLEAERLGRREQSVWSTRNRMLHYLVIQAGLLAGGYAVAGGAGVLFLLLQALVAVQLLETVNYVEHYGLTRASRPEGGYEGVRPVHSWDSAHRLTNWTLFNLGLHADHHTHAGKPYAELRPEPAAPRMPTGYSGMVLLALVPPLWFRVMNPRVQTWRGRQRADLSALGG